MGTGQSLFGAIGSLPVGLAPADTPRDMAALMAVGSLGMLFADMSRQRTE